jgi:hypothetical protein
MMVAAVVAGCSSSAEKEKPAQSIGPLDGTYRLDFDASKRTALGQPSPGANPFNRKWAFRSHCADGGACVATATRINNDGSASNTKTTLDLIDGKWVMVLGEDSKCNQGGQPARVLGTWVLEPQPDKTLTGTWTEITTGSDCPWVLQMPVKATREGDVPDGVDVTDPSSLPAWKPSRPQGFQGTYNQHVAFRAPDEGTPADVPVDVKTYCVRNTDECASTQAMMIAGKAQLTPLTFGGDRWTYRWARSGVVCPDGVSVQSWGNDDIPFPDAATDPIASLTGSRRLETVEPCATEQLFDLQYTRIDAPAAAPAAPAPVPAPEPAPAPAPEPAPAPGG